MASNYHSRILRESLRDGNHSVASSTGSQHGTVSPDSTFSNMSFNPDQNDPYSESTRIFDEPSLPKLRDPAKKYKYPFALSRSPELIIDTSALRKTFPSFSQSPRDRIDMEKIARLAAQSRNVEPTSTRMPRAESTNQQKPFTPSTKEQSRRGPTLQKENVTPSSYVSGATRTRDGGIRRSLADLHPKVRDESDFSFVSERLEKSSRFSGTDYTQQSQNTTNTQPAKSQPTSKTTRTASQKAAPVNPSNSHKVASSKPQQVKPQDSTIDSSNFPNPTQQSFLLPKNVPEISELVTSTFKDGSPVYVSSGAVQSRFSNAGKPLPQKYVAVDGIEVPQDEQDIFLSLQMMQERITQLEGDKSDAQRIANDLDKENYKLRDELKQTSAGRRRSDSAIADTSVDAEKSKLQEEINNLKLEAEASKRKIQTLELHLTNNTTERDRAISRVAEYNKTCERVKSENIGLKNEVNALRQQGEHVASQREASQQELQQTESSWQSLRAELEHKITVLEDNAGGYEHYIADIRKLYVELEQSERSSKEEVASLKRQLQNSKNLYNNSLEKHQQKEGEFQEKEAEWKAKIYRLEKALRRVLGLKYEKHLATKKHDAGASIPKPILIKKASGSAPTSFKQAEAGDAFEDSALFGRETEDTTTTKRDMLKRKDNDTTAPQKNVSPAKENGNSNKTGNDTLFDAISPRTRPSAGNDEAIANTAAPEKVNSNAHVGPKTALTNAAINFYGFGDFSWEFNHNDDLTRSSNFDSVVGTGVMQELRDDVANAGQMPAASSNALNANLTNRSEHRSPFSDIGDDDFDLNADAKTSTSFHKNNTQQELNQRHQLDSEFGHRVPKNPTRLNNNPNKSDVPETPLGTTQQRYQQRRHSDGSLEINGDDNQTAMTSVSEKSTAQRKRSRSQNSMVSGVSRTSRVSNHHRNNSDNMTSAYIIPDIDVPLSIASKQARSRRLSDAPVCGHGLPYQGPNQCDTCARTASSIIDAQESTKNNTKPVPVSDRMPTATDSQDEPTLRPSMPPMNALAEVLRSMLEEERKMKKKLSDLQYDLNSHDSSLARSKRTALAAEIAKLLTESQKKADQIYFLYDVLEGLKETEEWQGIQDYVFEGLKDTEEWQGIQD